MSKIKDMLKAIISSPKTFWSWLRNLNNIADAKLHINILVDRLVELESKLSEEKQFNWFLAIENEKINKDMEYQQDRDASKIAELERNLKRATDAAIEWNSRFDAIVSIIDEKNLDCALLADYMGKCIDGVEINKQTEIALGPTTKEINCVDILSIMDEG